MTPAVRMLHKWENFDRGFPAIKIYDGKKKRKYTIYKEDFSKLSDILDNIYGLNAYE